MFSPYQNSQFNFPQTSSFSQFPGHFNAQQFNPYISSSFGMPQAPRQLYQPQNNPFMTSSQNGFDSILSSLGKGRNGNFNNVEDLIKFLKESKKPDYDEIMSVKNKFKNLLEKIGIKDSASSHSRLDEEKAKNSELFLEGFKEALDDISSRIDSVKSSKLNLFSSSVKSPSPPVLSDPMSQLRSSMPFSFPTISQNSRAPLNPSQPIPGIQIQSSSQDIKDKPSVKPKSSSKQNDVKTDDKPKHHSHQKHHHKHHKPHHSHSKSGHHHKRN